ncbi:centrosomal protein of 89 kDa-like [Frieseomelitta varia]|uniref:centrosomal protein of 89 kDa-like n=1 Tax=Frieseomelitta varia TaxID=561572 RepID=UPI001CB6A9CD|nr:centrosomal protein of 89 kDa-like [Frieseomelitta varia]
MASYGSIDKNEKHNCRKTTDIMSNQDTASIPIYRRRRISKTKHILKTCNAHEYPSDWVIDNINELPFRNKGKTYEHERSKNLSEHNIPQKQVFDEGDADSGIISSRTKRRISKDTTKIINEYNKLGKCYKSAKEECQKLNDTLEQRELEHKKICSHYEALIHELEGAKITLVKHNQKLEIENVQSTEDIALLKNIVYQLNTELERYQDKLGDQKREHISTHTENERKYDSRIWKNINFHALGPLLNAYQENLSEKQELVQMYEQEMADFSSRCKEILVENEFMHKEVEELKLECNRYAKEIKKLVENITSLKKQNDILRKEAANIKRETNDIHSSYELKMEVILKCNETLKKEYTTSASELSNLRGKYEILSKEFEKMKGKENQTVPTIIHTTAIEECKTLLDELKHQYESEKRNLCNHIKRIEENQPENEKQLIMVTAERNHLKGLVENLETTLKQTQRKIEHMQTLIYSTRISRNSLKEKLSKMTVYCEELFSKYERTVAEREKLLSFLCETEKENVNMDRLGKSINNRMEGLKSQLEIVQKGTKQQVDSVEKRIKLQEVHVRRMKLDYQRKIQYLNDIIKQQENIIEKLQKEKYPSQENSTRRTVQTTNDVNLGTCNTETKNL